MPNSNLKSGKLNEGSINIVKNTRDYSNDPTLRKKAERAAERLRNIVVIPEELKDILKKKK